MPASSDTFQPDMYIDTAIVAGPAAVGDLPWPDACGAEGLFIGRTRADEHPQLGRLLRLEYEAYDAMALKLMEQMARDVGLQYDARAVRLVHATGAVAVGQASVVIQVATPHRAASLDACRYLIDRLKHELPIWKRETWERGQTYVHGSVAHHPRPGDLEQKSP